MSIDDNFMDPMDDVLADNLVEVLATMTKDQREKFVKTFVSRVGNDWANTISISSLKNLFVFCLSK